MIHHRTIATILSLCLLSSVPSHAASLNAKTLGEQCRQSALAMDTLSRYQDRAFCSQLLNATDVYFASQSIIAGNNTDAQNRLGSAITRVKFATDIGCYGQSNLKDLSGDLQGILNQLTSSS